MGSMCCVRMKMHLGCDLTEWIPIDQTYFIVGQNLLKRRQQNKIGADKAV